MGALTGFDTQPDQSQHTPYPGEDVMTEQKQTDIGGPWPEWMKPATAARYVDMAPRTFYRWFKGERVNGRVARADLDAQMERERAHRLGRVA